MGPERQIAYVTFHPFPQQELTSELSPVLRERYLEGGQAEAEISRAEQMRNMYSHRFTTGMCAALTLTQLVSGVRSGRLQWGTASALTTPHPQRRIAGEEVEEEAKCPDKNEQTTTINSLMFIYLSIFLSIHSLIQSSILLRFVAAHNKFLIHPFSKPDTNHIYSLITFNTNRLLPDVLTGKP